MKIEYWVFCAKQTQQKISNFDLGWNTYYSVFKLQPNTIMNTIQALENHPNTNTNTIQFENICRIRIRISLFGLNYSNTIRIPNYSLTSDPIQFTKNCDKKAPIGWSIWAQTCLASEEAIREPILVTDQKSQPAISFFLHKWFSFSFRIGEGQLHKSL